MEGIMKTLMAAMHAARIDPPPEGLPARCANAMARRRQLCGAHRMDEHSVLHAVVSEFLCEWNVIRRPVAEPHLSLSSHGAEQALRHWVISRTTSHGARAEEGSRVCLGFPGLPHRNQSPSRSIRLAGPRHRHRRRAQRLAVPRDPRHPGNRAGE